MSLFSQNLRYLRKKNNRNQDEIAILFHKQANTIGNWENQKSEPNIAELLKLADFFKVTVGDLLHADLEQESPYSLPDAALSGAGTSFMKSYSMDEPFVNIPGEAGHELFRLILRELRTINERLELLAGRMQIPSIQSLSDKSNH